MRTQPTGPRCCVCGRLRPDECWAFGLTAVLDGRTVAWLCDECEALDGKGWAFVDAIHQFYPGAEIVSTTAYADSIVRAPLVAPTYVEG